ncbi:unnamed protein product, partial [Urochloa humidicola]
CLSSSPRLSRLSPEPTPPAPRRRALIAAAAPRPRARPHRRRPDHAGSSPPPAPSLPPPARRLRPCLPPAAVSASAAAGRLLTRLGRPSPSLPPAHGCLRPHLPAIFSPVSASPSLSTTSLLRRLGANRSCITVGTGWSLRSHDLWLRHRSGIPFQLHQVLHAWSPAKGARREHRLPEALTQHARIQ